MALNFYLELVNTKLFVSHMAQSLCDLRRELPEINRKLEDKAKLFSFPEY